MEDRLAGSIHLGDRDAEFEDEDLFVVCVSVKEILEGG